MEQTPEPTLEPSLEQNPLRFGLEVREEPAPFTAVIFGATGNLARRRLIPALLSLYERGHYSRFRIVGFARRPWTDEAFRAAAAESLPPPRDESGAGAGIGPGRREFLSRLTYIASRFDDPAGFDRLAGLLSGEPLVVFYLSTPPEAYPGIIALLGEKGLARPNARIVVEKPFGRDLASARALNAALLERFREPEVFRIDHYLGKETVQNLMVLRFGNAAFEPVWNNRYVHHVEITMAETAGMEGRGPYYERSGAARDMLQNHLLQLLAITAMEPPGSLAPEAIRDEKVKALRAVRPAADNGLVRGQYAAGLLAGEPVPGYREEPGVDRDSAVETYAAAALCLDTGRWSGVPFFLRTGKRLSRRLTEIAVQFKRPPLDLFASFPTPPQPNVLAWRVQPDEGMRFTFNSKVPGFERRLSPVQMRFTYGASFGEESPDAYERLLLDVLSGDATLFARNDEIEAAWTYTDRLLALAESEGARGLYAYPAGTAGPPEADRFLSPYGASWRRL